MNDSSTWFGIAACITALATLVQTIRATTPPKRRRRRSTDTNSTPPPAPPVEPEPAARAAIAWRGALALIFAGASIVTGHPAYALDVVPAHHAEISGVSTCSAGDQIVTWSIGNSQPKEAMTIVSARAALQGDVWPVVGYTSPVAPSGATEATTTLPGGSTGALVLTVRGSWPDGHRSARQASVGLSGDCPPPTSTTTAPPTSTSEPTTTTSTPAPSTTSAPQPATTPTTLAPATSSPSPSTSTPWPTSLALTGSPVLGPVIAGLAVILLGVTFIMAFRADRRLGRYRRRRRQNERNDGCNGNGGKS